MQEGLLLGIGNPLLDLTVKGNQRLLDKYHLSGNDAVIAGEQQRGLYDDLMQNYEVKFTAGGSVQNSLRVCQWILKQPRVCTFMGSVGKDKYSEILKVIVTGDGVNVLYQYHDKMSTGKCAVITTDKNGSKRSLCANLAAAEAFTIDHIRIPANRRFIDISSFCYISGFFLTVSPETVYEVADLAASQKKVFVTNLSAPFICQIYKERLMHIMPYVDVLFGNEAEAQAFARELNFETTDMKAISLKLMNLPKKTDRKRIVIITQGHLPVIVANEGRSTEYPVPDLPKELIADTNGAGDAFVGGFLSQLIQGKDIEQCIRCAIWAANHIIQNPGCNFDKSLSYTG